MLSGWFFSLEMTLHGYTEGKWTEKLSVKRLIYFGWLMLLIKQVWLSLDNRCVLAICLPTSFKWLSTTFLMLLCSKSAWKLHFTLILLLCDGPMDQRMDTPSYRDERTHLKKMCLSLLCTTSVCNEIWNSKNKHFLSSTNKLSTNILFLLFTSCACDVTQT